MRRLIDHIKGFAAKGIGCALLLLIAVLSACAPEEPTLTPTPQATATDAPTVTPAHTATPIPTHAGPTVSIPTPIPTEGRDYNLCVDIVSDSNGFGHVTFFVPEIERVAITYITPLWVPLQAHLNALGLEYLEVLDRSLSAGGLTIASSNYLDSHQYWQIRNDDCKFVIITPFMPDVSVNLSRPEDYVTNLEYVIRALDRDGSESRVLVLNYYRTYRADFTADNSGYGQTPERLAAFNEALASACAAGGAFSRYSQVVCIDTQPFFEGMGQS